MKAVEGKVAVVTGASKGIGSGIARALGEAGASVVVNYASDAGGAQRTVEAIRQTGGRAIAVQGSVTSAEDLRKLFAAALNEFGRLDILVNNAGVYSFAPLEDVTEAEYRRQFDTNVLGTLLATQEAVKHFGEAGGSVINIGSIVSTNPIPGSSIYSATKAAVENITITFARELAPRGIRVNSIAPGITHSEGLEAVGMAGTPAADDMVNQTPLKRLGQPEDIGLAAVLLASEQSRWITGETVRVAGGLR